ncbi:ferredoxin [Mycolicibacterium arabiense]|uniref:Ferredoxin n=1 Tax=Mycolicibacterium arabiense TaxID=1286181 RepID=A0A7I7S024_9MYCO|nr:ferredoxin [Mycolicibacterium arabiense]MCV7371121.1 ferredoxin [Mycolicibacterium arabiense]BBY49811.1 ferredoxin [Mycolicibacterium arabiense]
MRVDADRDACISAGNCVMTADEVFDQDDDGIVVVLVSEVSADDEAKVREAVKLCPASALRLVD